jgi:engulfment/cell motility protein 1
MSVLAAIVGNPSRRHSQPGVTGFQRLKPIIESHKQFLPSLVEKMTSADHALCANSLQLINALMRDTIANEADSEWPRFIKQLQELGVIKSVYGLMQGSAVQDLAHPLLDFQSLTKILLRRWREEKVDLEKADHRRAIRGLHVASNPDQPGTDPKGSKRQNPAKWRRLGFESESPAFEFNPSGFLGLMDLTDFVYKNEDGFQKLLLEQSAVPLDHRCPIARASLAVTSILYDHFEVDKSDESESNRHTVLDSRANFERAFKPLLLHWSRLHTSGLNAFIRLWKAAGAQLEDFEKIEELVRILTEQVVGQAPRTKEIKDVEEELADFDIQRLRELQMELLELTYEDAWGHHLRSVPISELVIFMLNYTQTSSRRAQSRSSSICQRAAYQVPAPGRLVSSNNELQHRHRTGYEQNPRRGDSFDCRTTGDICTFRTSMKSCQQSLGWMPCKTKVRSLRPCGTVRAGADVHL